MKSNFKKMMAITLVVMMIAVTLPVSAIAEYGAKLVKSALGNTEKAFCSTTQSRQLTDKKSGDGSFRNREAQVKFNVGEKKSNKTVPYKNVEEGHWLIFETNEDANDMANGFTPWNAYDSSRYSKPEDDPNVETSRAKLITPVFIPEGCTPADVDMPEVFHAGDQYGGYLYGNASDYYLEPGTEAYDYFDVYRRGYDFGGWYNESSMITAFDPNEELTEDTTVYAKWDFGQSSVRVFLYKETNDSPTYNAPSATPKFGYYALSLLAEHMGAYTTVNNNPADRSANRIYEDGIVIHTGDTFSLTTADIDYFRTHEAPYNPVSNFFDTEFEFFYFEPNDTRYTSRQITSAPVRGDGTSTLEFYLRRCAYEYTLYQGSGSVSSAGSIHSGNYIFIGSKRSSSTNTSAPYEVIEYRNGTWYYKGSNDVCSSPKKFAPANTSTVGNILLQYKGLYYRTVDNYPTIPDGIVFGIPGYAYSAVTFSHFYDLKPAGYFEAVYDPATYSTTGGYAPTKTYSNSIVNFNYNEAAIVRMSESAEEFGTYEYRDMEYWWANCSFDWGFDNLQGFFPSYLDVYTANPTNWQNVVNSSNTKNPVTRYYLSNLSPDDIWEEFEEMTFDLLYTDYPDDPIWTTYDENDKTVKDAIIEHFRSEYPDHYIWTEYTLSSNPTTKEIYDLFRMYYPYDPLWNGPQTCESHTSMGAYVITYASNGNETGVNWVTNWNQYRYVDTGNRNQVMIIHYARKSYPVAYTSNDAAGFGLLAENTWITYGLTANQELSFRPSFGMAIIDNPYYTPDGKVFDEWYNDRELLEPINLDIPFDAHGQLLYAGYSTEKYRVVLHYGSEEYPDMQFPNGIPNSTLLVEHGDMLDPALANAAVLDEYDLVGWVDENGTPFNFDYTNISSNIADMSYAESSKEGSDEFGRVWDDSMDYEVQGIIDVYAQWEEKLFIDGDVDGDGMIGFNDVSVVFFYLLNSNVLELTPKALARADLNHDGVITIADITLLYNLLLGG